MGSEDSRIKVASLLVQYGFKKVQKNLFETTTLNEKNLARFKIEVDKLTDSYDILRLYQYPIDGTLVITLLEAKKWRRYTVKPQ